MVVTITSSAHLYWTDFSAGTISEANLDGSNARTIITGQTGPQGVAVNSSNLYWANQDLGTISEAVPRSLTAEIEEVRAEIVAGRIKVPDSVR